MVPRSQDNRGESKEVCIVFVFLGAEVSGIALAKDMGKGDLTVLDRFTDGIFTDIVVAKALR
jgi:hypothetical protein